MEIIKKQSFDEERALYNLTDAEVCECRFEGPLDGESALKECRGVTVRSSSFTLRYPLWHADIFRLIDSSMDMHARAPIWYSTHGSIEKCKIFSIKALRECSSVKIKDSEINSPEFGWKCSDITVSDSYVEGEYLFLDSKNIRIDRMSMKGKYSFQYIDGLTIDNSTLDTKDAFWHSKNVTVRNSVVKGEYLGWFSENLTLINCEIIGTQPLCYCKNLTLIGCTTKECDLSFEYSDVNADIIGHIDSVKNPRSGRIVADSVGEIIYDQSVIDALGKVEIRK